MTFATGKKGEISNNGITEFYDYEVIFPVLVDLWFSLTVQLTLKLTQMLTTYIYLLDAAQFHFQSFPPCHTCPYAEPTL